MRMFTRSLKILWGCDAPIFVCYKSVGRGDGGQKQKIVSKSDCLLRAGAASSFMVLGGGSVGGGGGLKSSSSSVKRVHTDEWSSSSVLRLKGYLGEGLLLGNARTVNGEGLAGPRSSSGTCDGVCVLRAATSATTRDRIDDRRATSVVSKESEPLS